MSTQQTLLEHPVSILDNREPTKQDRARLYLMVRKRERYFKSHIFNMLGAVLFDGAKWSERLGRVAPSSHMTVCGKSELIRDYYGDTLHGTMEDFWIEPLTLQFMEQNQRHICGSCLRSVPVKRLVAKRRAQAQNEAERLSVVGFTPSISHFGLVQLTPEQAGEIATFLRTRRRT
jgi:hypothetical protein